MKTLKIKVAKDQVAAKAKKHMEVNWKVGENIEELSKQFGADIVYQHAVASFVIALQSGARVKLNAEKEPIKTLEGLQKWADAYKPGKRAAGVSKVTKAKKLLEALSDEERAALFAEHGSKKPAGKK